MWKNFVVQLTDWGVDIHKTVDTLCQASTKIQANKQDVFL